MSWSHGDDFGTQNRNSFIRFTLEILTSLVIDLITFQVLTRGPGVGGATEIGDESQENGDLRIWLLRRSGKCRRGKCASLGSSPPCP